MVGASGCGVDKAAGNARDQEAVVNLEFDGVLKWSTSGFKHAVKLLGLRDGAGEAVEDEAGQCRVSTRPGDDAAIKWLVGEEA